MFTHLNSIIPLDLKTIEGVHGRQYIIPNGNKYPSITTILGQQEKPQLTNWKNMLGPQRASTEMRRAAERGTAVHLMLERHLQNDPNPTKDQHIIHVNEFNSLRLFVKNINNIVLQEGALYSDILRVAGRVDCIAEYNGTLSIIDFKTANRGKSESLIEDYFLQTTAYALMFEELYNIQIDDIVIIMSVEKGSVPLIFREKVEGYIEPLVRRINKYYNTN